MYPGRMAEADRELFAAGETVPPGLYEIGISPGSSRCFLPCPQGPASGPGQVRNRFETVAAQRIMAACMADLPATAWAAATKQSASPAVMPMSPKSPETPSLAFRSAQSAYSLGVDLVNRPPLGRARRLKQFRIEGVRQLGADNGLEHLRKGVSPRQRISFERIVLGQVERGSWSPTNGCFPLRS